LKALFMSDPKAVLAEHGIDVPADIDVNVVENSDNTVHITMPAAPAGDGELSDEEVSNVAGDESGSMYAPRYQGGPAVVKSFLEKNPLEGMHEYMMTNAFRALLAPYDRSNTIPKFIYVSPDQIRHKARCLSGSLSSVFVRKRYLNP
jgi:hypothetical protein